MALTKLDPDYYNAESCNHPVERNLLAAVLYRALCDSVSPKSIEYHNKDEIQKEAYAWIMSDEVECEKNFSFIYICQELELNESCIRKIVENEQIDAKFVDMRLLKKG